MAIFHWILHSLLCYIDWSNQNGMEYYWNIIHYVLIMLQMITTLLFHNEVYVSKSVFVLTGVFLESFDVFFSSMKLYTQLKVKALKQGWLKSMVFAKDGGIGIWPRGFHVLRVLHRQIEY